MIELTRGIRNNNPFNIEYNKNNNWLGQRGHDSRFCIFDKMEHGVRAGMILLMNYRLKYRLYTPYQIIQRFCPDGVDDYLENIYDLSYDSLDRDTKIDSLRKFLDLCRSMLIVESALRVPLSKLYYIYETLPKSKQIFTADWDTLNFTD